MESSNRPPANGSTAAAAVRQPVLPEHSSDATSNEIKARAARVAELRSQYLQGTLQVDAQKLASDLIDKHLKK
jgi:anti-sigma28 factor (negative regulator of flagellin synthesis)